MRHGRPAAPGDVYFNGRSAPGKNRGRLQAAVTGHTILVPSVGDACLQALANQRCDELRPEFSGSFAEPCLQPVSVPMPESSRRARAVPFMRRASRPSARFHALVSRAAVDASSPMRGPRVRQTCTVQVRWFAIGTSVGEMSVSVQRSRAVTAAANPRCRALGRMWTSTGHGASAT